jgi:uncharacterized protein
VMGWLGSRFFARGLRGFGLRVRGLAGDLGWSLVYLVAIMPVVMGALHLVQWAGQRYLQEFEMERNEVLVVLMQHEQVWVIALVVVMAAVVVPIFEELLFRGMLQTSLRNVLRGRWAAIVISSIVFALLHPLTHAPALLLFSLAIGYSYERSGSLMRPIFMHMIFNAVSVAGVLWSAGEAGA